MISVDLFAGGGGASEGIRQALGVPPTDADIAARLDLSVRQVQRIRAELGLRRKRGRRSQGREAWIQIRVSPEEHAAIHAAAEQEGVSVSDYLRGLAIGSSSSGSTA